MSYRSTVWIWRGSNPQLRRFKRWNPDLRLVVRVELEGVAPSSPQCHCGVLLLNYSPQEFLGAVPWNCPRISGVSIPCFSHQAQTAFVLAERARIELVGVDRQSTGSPAAIALRGCYVLRDAFWGASPGLNWNFRSHRPACRPLHQGHRENGGRGRPRTVIDPRNCWCGERESNPRHRSGAPICFRNTSTAGGTYCCASVLPTDAISSWWGRTGLHRLASGYQPDALLAVSYAPRKHARMGDE